MPLLLSALFRRMALTVACISTMPGFAAYVEEGVTLALSLANLSSAYRRGLPASQDEPLVGGEVRVTDPQALRHLSRRLRTVVTQPDPAVAAALLNEMFVEQRAAPQLALEGGRWRLHLHPAHSTGEALDAVKAASGLAALLDQDGWATLRVCAASRCDDAFHDQSRNRGRRYCSRTCANRINAEHSRATRHA